MYYYRSMSATILIVEDDEPIQQMYAAKLRLHKYKVLTAENGIDGLKAYEDHHPDLILLDLMMPKMSGDEMLQRLREMEYEAKQTKLTKVIVLTNISRDEAPPSIGKYRLPFGTFLCASAIFVLFCGDALLGWYASLFRY